MRTRNAADDREKPKSFMGERVTISLLARRNVLRPRHHGKDAISFVAERRPEEPARDQLECALRVCSARRISLRGNAPPAAAACRRSISFAGTAPTIDAVNAPLNRACW